MARVIVQGLLAGFVLGVLGAVSIGLDQALLVPSLGAAVLLQVHLPDLPSARPYNTAVGQLCGVACGFGALYILGAAHDPPFSAPHALIASRVFATMMAVAGTLVLQTLLRAVSPAGGATALISTLGSETADWAGLARFVTAILLLTAVGEAARRLVLRMN